MEILILVDSRGALESNFGYDNGSGEARDVDDCVEVLSQYEQRRYADWEFSMVGVTAVFAQIDVDDGTSFTEFFPYDLPASSYDNLVVISDY